MVANKIRLEKRNVRGVECYHIKRTSRGGGYGSFHPWQTATKTATFGGKASGSQITKNLDAQGAKSLLNKLGERLHLRISLATKCPVQFIAKIRAYSLWIWNRHKRVLLLLLLFIAFPLVVVWMPRISLNFLPGILAGLMTTAGFIGMSLVRFAKPKARVCTPAIDPEDSEELHGSCLYNPGFNDTTFMNILRHKAGPYDASKFSMKMTQTVMLKLQGTKLQIHFLMSPSTLPYHKFHTENEDDYNSLRFMPDPMICDLSRASIQMLPTTELSKSRRLKATNPIGLSFKFSPGASPLRPHVLYLFPRTNRDKEHWFKKLYAMIHLARGNKPMFATVAERFNFHLCSLSLKRSALGHKVYDQLSSTINEIITSLWFNLRESKAFKDFVVKKIDYNLQKTKAAKLFKRVSVTSVSLGQFAPYLTRTRYPYENDEGIFCDFDLAYNSHSEVTIELSGLKEGKGNWKHLTNFASTYLLTEPIRITGKLRKLHGVATINIPPPPTDRIWYGFRKPPELDMSIIPHYRTVCFFGQGNSENRISLLESCLLLPLMSYLESFARKQILRIAVYPNLKSKVIPGLKPQSWSKKRRWFT